MVKLTCNKNINNNFFEGSLNSLKSRNIGTIIIDNKKYILKKRLQIIQMNIFSINLIIFYRFPLNIKNVNPNMI